MSAIKAIKLTKQYKDLTAVDSLDLEIEEGELFGLLGVNGAGKTTTIKMLSCLTHPTSGDAILSGHSINSDPQAVKQIIAVSPQETAVAPNLTVRENLELMAGVHGASVTDANARAREIMEQFSLECIATKRSHTLSGGWQRRLSIAMALISHPQILFLDEPTLGLDVIARRELWNVIKSLKGKITIILTTHYLEEAQSLCDRIAVMTGGHICALGTADELISSTGEKNFEDAFVKIVGGVAE